MKNQNPTKHVNLDLHNVDHVSSEVRSPDGINLDPKTQIKYIDTKHQLADTLTKGNFTRDEWNNFFCSSPDISAIFAGRRIPA